MSKDNVLPSRNCFCAYVKTDVEHIDDNFFSLVRDKDCTKELYRVPIPRPTQFFAINEKLLLVRSVN